MTNLTAKNNSPFSATGRFGRYSFLAWHFVTLCLLFLFLAAIDAYLPNYPEQANIGKLMEYNGFYKFGTIAVISFFIIVFFIFVVRRLHDVNMSGWWAILGFIPYINYLFYLFLVVQTGTAGENRFGPPRETATWERIVGFISMILIILSILGGIIMLANMPPQKI